MPGGDGTGPAGMGPMTGRAAGYCAGNATPGYINPVGRQGFQGGGRGRGGGGGGGGGGRGRRNQFYATGLTGWQRAAMGWPGFGAVPTPVAPPVAPVAPVTPYGASPAPTMNLEQQLDMLKGQAEYFEDALEGIRKQIEEMEAKNKRG